MDLSFYKGKKVFITGHTGFKGSWLTKWLHMLGSEVKGYALVPKNLKDVYNVINGNELCQSVISDIRDKTRLRAEILDFEPDLIFHLAAQPLVRFSYDAPIETFEVNVMGSIHVLDAIRELKNPCAVVMITTDKVYENREWHYPYRETDRLGGRDPYSASKAAAEIAIESYRLSFFPPNDFKVHKKSIAVARAGNVIGGGDWAENRLIPDIVKSLELDETVIVRNPYAIRPWQHVLEPVKGYLTLGSHLLEAPELYSDSYNFGPNFQDTLNVEEVVQKSIEIWGKGEYNIQIDSKAPHEAGLLKLDISKSIAKLNWVPKLNSNEAIKWTIDFYKSNNKQAKIEEQILSYQTL